MRKQIGRKNTPHFYGIWGMLMLLGVSYSTEYTNFAKELQDAVKDMPPKGYKEIVIKSDSILIDRSANPTAMRTLYDTVVEQILDEEDFVLIEYLAERRVLQRLEADDISKFHLSFTDMKFVKGDTMVIQLDNILRNSACDACVLTIYKKGVHGW